MGHCAEDSISIDPIKKKIEDRTKRQTCIKTNDTIVLQDEAAAVVDNDEENDEEVSHIHHIQASSWHQHKIYIR